MGQKLETIISKENAQWVQTISPDMIALYREVDGQAQKSVWARTGAGLRGTDSFVERDEWHIIGLEIWLDCYEIPFSHPTFSHPTWPLRPAYEYLLDQLVGEEWAEKELPPHPRCPECDSPDTEPLYDDPKGRTGCHTCHVAFKVEK
jgi:hypothetical protein